MRFAARFEMRSLKCVAAIIVLAVLCSGCEQSPMGPLSPNTPPDTHLTVGAGVREGAGYRVTAHWGGDDSDGYVSSYRVKLDDGPWWNTSRTDSVFTFSQPDGAPLAAEDSRVHTLQVAAVDDDGLADPAPACVVFTPRNNLPETQIVTGPSGVTGPMVIFTWQGSDSDGFVVGFGYALYEWEAPIEEWLEIASEDSLGAEVTSMAFGPLDGRYRFDVWAIDDEGGIDPTPATREFICIPELVGPKLYVNSNVFATKVYRGPQWQPEHDLYEPIFEGDHLEFDWVASASEYGGEITGYRFAYDDTLDWSPWSLTARHFDILPSVGQHALYVDVLDNVGMLTKGKIAFDVIETDLDSYILIIDDYDHNEGHPVWASDAQRDAFYDTLTTEFSRPAIQWEPSYPELVPPVDLLAGASSVIWYVDTDAEALQSAFFPYSSGYSVLPSYVRVGGNLILCGFEALSQIAGESYPFAVSPDDTTRASVFIRDVLGVGAVASSGHRANKDAPWEYGYCFLGAELTTTGVPEAAIYELQSMWVDTLGKWSHLYESSHPSYAGCGLPRLEALTPSDGAAIEAFSAECFLNFNFQGTTCALLSYTGSAKGNVCYFGFPLFFMKTPEVKPVVRALLELFGESSVETGVPDLPN